MRALALVLAAAFVTATQPTDPLQSCVLVADVSDHSVQRLVGSPRECATRLSPASTYKIPHALIALESAVISETSIEPWNGVRHPGQPKWEQDHTVLSAMRPSVLWFFQTIAPRIGAPRAHEWLERFGYGNADTSGPITQYWINGRLRLSPDEQLAFLERFYSSTLPVTRRYLDDLKGALEQAPAPSRMRAAYIVWMSPGTHSFHLMRKPARQHS
jgi:beta-lactamase class D